MIIVAFCIFSHCVCFFVLFVCFVSDVFVCVIVVFVFDVLLFLFYAVYACYRLKMVLCCFLHCLFWFVFVV